MSVIVEKWVAGWVFGNVTIGQVQFRKTAKLYILEDSRGPRPKLQRALNYGTRFQHDDDRLKDTRDEALNYLIERQLDKIKRHRADITLAEKHISAVKVVRDA